MSGVLRTQLYSVSRVVAAPFSADPMVWWDLHVRCILRWLICVRAHPRFQAPMGAYSVQ